MVFRIFWSICLDRTCNLVENIALCQANELRNGNIASVVPVRRSMGKTKSLQQVDAEHDGPALVSLNYVSNNN